LATNPQTIEAVSSIWHRLYPLSRFIRIGLVHFPLLAGFLSFLFKASLVAEPAGRMTFLPFPVEKLTPSSQKITVLSANLWHDWPRHRDLTTRLEAFAQLAERENADILLLQEVARTKYIDSAAWLADRLGMAYVYARANGHERGIGFEEGLAVLSRYPLYDPEVLPLSDGLNPFSRRIALTAQVQLPDGQVDVVSAHLGLVGAANQRQQAWLREWVTHEKGAVPVIIGGDFNAAETTLQIQQTQQSWIDTLRAVDSETEGITHVLEWPWGSTMREDRLDYIFISPGGRDFQVLETYHLTASGPTHSDHQVVLTRLQVQKIDL